VDEGGGDDIVPRALGRAHLSREVLLPRVVQATPTPWREAAERSRARRQVQTLHGLSTSQVSCMLSFRAVKGGRGGNTTANSGLTLRSPQSRRGRGQRRTPPPWPARRLQRSGGHWVRNPWSWSLALPGCLRVLLARGRQACLGAHAWLAGAHQLWSGYTQPTQRAPACVRIELVERSAEGEAAQKAPVHFERAHEDDGGLGGVRKAWGAEIRQGLSAREGGRRPRVLLRLLLHIQLTM